MDLLVGGRESLSVETCLAAHVVPLGFPRTPNGQVPWAVVGHGTLDRERAPVFVGDDQEKRRGRGRIGHSSSIADPSI